MYCRQTLRLLAAAVVCLALCSCARTTQARHGIPVIGVLPLEDDSAEGAADGFGNAAPYLLQWQLDGTPDRYVFAAGDANAAAGEHATRVLYGWYMRTRTGVEAHVALRDAGRHRTLSTRILRGDPATVLNGIARLIDARARELHSDDDPAIASLARVLAASGSTRLEVLQTELKTTSPFVPAVLLLARSLLEQGQGNATAQLLQRAQPAFAHAAPLDRARAVRLLASASGDRSAQATALASIVKLAPSDPVARRELSDLQFSARDWKGAAESYDALARIQPWDGIIFNQLAYARMFLHDAAGARAAIAEYRQAAPEQTANAADSLGEINWDFGDYRHAEQNFLEASQGDIVLLRGNDRLKAAEARLLAGDRAGADRLFQRYAAWRASSGDALIPVRRAQWLYISGRSGEAITNLLAAIGSLQGDAQAAGLAQLSFWTLLAGNRTEAYQLAGRAAAAAVSPAIRGTASLCALYASPSAPSAEWASRAQRDGVLGTALFFDGHFAEALAPLSRALAATPPVEDGYVRGMLIRDMLALRRGPDAERLKWPMPMPFYNGDPIFDAAWLPAWRHP